MRSRGRAVLSVCSAGLGSALGPGRGRKDMELSCQDCAQHSTRPPSPSISTCLLSSEPPAHWEAAVDSLSGHRPALVFPALHPFSLTTPSSPGCPQCPVHTPLPPPIQGLHSTTFVLVPPTQGTECVLPPCRGRWACPSCSGFSESVDRASISLPGALTRPMQTSPRSWTAQQAD